MNRGNGTILALAVAALTACASGGGGAGGAGVTEGRPGDNAHTRSAGVHLVQATTSQGEEATEHYRLALQDALASIEMDSTNAKGYLLAGQASVGVGDWVRADTMFEHAVEIFPGYADQIMVEREEAWVASYNQGIEEVNANNVEAARDLFAAADRLYQERPEARLNLGWANMRLGNTEAAIAAYRGALEILYRPVPEGLAEDQAAAWVSERQTASFNLAQLLAQNGQPGEAAEVMAEFLEENADVDEATRLRAMTAQANFLAQADRGEEAQAMMNEIMARSDLESADYFQIGIGYFNTGDYTQAAEAFQRAADLNPYSRDALLNLVQSLYSETLDLEEEPAGSDRDEQLRDHYTRILESAEQVQSFDPLNRNLLSFMLRAYRGLADLSERAEAERFRQSSQDLFRQYNAQSYEVSDISLNLQTENQTSVRALFTNLSGQAGSAVTIRFTAVNRAGTTLDSEDVSVTVPPAGESVEVSTQLDLGAGDFAGWKYELVP